MTFDEWLDEIEVFASRLERLYGDFPEVEDKEKLLKWLKAAYSVGYDEASTKYAKALEVYKRERDRFKHAKPEMTGEFFIAGSHGPKDDNVMPQFIEVCPAYGVGWVMIYEDTGRTINYEGS